MSAAEAPLYSLKQVGDGIFAAIATEHSKAGANASFIIGKDGVVVVDTFEDADAAKKLLEDIRAKTNLPIKFVVNTHYHLDHVAGNAVFADAGAIIIAQRNVYGWLHTENLKFFGDKITPEQKQMVESLALPNLTYEDGVDLYLGPRRIAVRFYPGHTGGDSVVAVPEANVVICGDLFWKRTIPNLIDASTKSWTETLEKLRAQYPLATFVPGHGDVGGAADLQAFHDYLVDLREAVQKAQTAGKAGSSLVDAVMPTMQQKYGSWDFFNFFEKRNIEQTEAELKGLKRLPKPSPAD
jgi:cyclase